MILVILLHFIFSSLIGIILSLFVGKLTVWISVISLVLGSAGAFYCRKIFDKEYVPTLRKTDIFEKVVYGFIILIGLRHFVYLIFNSNNSLKTLLKNNYGDLPLHITFIRHISSGASFPPDNPIWGFDKLRYPLGIDFYNSLWDRLGVPIHSHMFLTGIILLIVSIAVLRWWGGIYTVGAFFLNGAWAGWKVFVEKRFIDFQDVLAWKNFFLSIFIPQRGFLIAIPLGAFLLKIGYDYFKGTTVLSKKQLTLFGFLWGVLALFHIHSFIIVSLLLASYVIIFKKYRSILPLLVWAVPIGALFILYSTNLFRGGSIINIKWGWMVEKHGLIPFWWKNLGPWLIFILGFFVFEMITGRSKNRIEWFAILFWFVIFNIVMLAAWDWDNIKILLWLYLCFVQLSYVSASSIEGKKWINKNIWLKPTIKSLLFILLFFSATVCLLSTVGKKARGHELYKMSEVWYTKGAVKNISTNMLFAGEPTWNNPLSFLGYKIVLGYSGHLWSHGIKADDKEKQLRSLYNGDKDWRTIVKELGVTHIFWGPREKRKFGIRAQIWTEELVNISNVLEYEVYPVDKEKPNETVISE